LENELKQAFENLKTIIGNNYKNLKDDVSDLKITINNLSNKYENINKEIGKNASDISNLKENFKTHKEDDKEYGKTQSDRIKTVENFQFKMILTIMGSSTISGTIAAVMVYLLK
jgi:chromosome segregation ATPase